jgi:hypothetical protein
MFWVFVAGVNASRQNIPGNDGGSKMRLGGILGVVVIVWLLIGVFAAYQRGYFSSSDQSCATAGTIALNVVAGPLNYMQTDPKVDCEIPEPV